MFDSSEFRDELQSLKDDVARLLMLKSTNDGIFDTTKSRAEALADQIKAALNDLSETLSRTGRPRRAHRIGSSDRLACFGFRAWRRRWLHAEETVG